MQVLAGVALVALYLWRLGAAPLFDVDEGAFAQASVEMIRSGDWGHTTLNGVDRFDKPILVYWLQAASLLIFGIHEWAVRLPSALSILLATLAVGRFATRQWGRTAGLYAALILATSAGVLAIGRASTADGLLNALLIATALSLWSHLESGERAPLRWAYAWSALGVLTKGPIAILIPLATLTLWALSRDRGRSAWRALTDLRGLLIFFVIAGPWYAYALMRHGDAFIEGFILRHNVQRFASALEGHSASLVYYLLVVPVLLMPWTPVLLSCVSQLRKQWTDPVLRYLWLWAGFVIAFFSISGTKLPHYALYGVAPLALLMGRQLACAGHRLRRAVWGAVTVQCLFAALAPTIVANSAVHVDDVWIRDLLLTAPAGEALEWAGLLMLAAVAILMYAGARRVRWAPAFMLPPLATAAVLSGLLWVGWLIPWVGQTLQEPFRKAGLWAHANDVALVPFRMNMPSVLFYSGRWPGTTTPVPGDWILQRRDRPWTSSALEPPVFEHRGLSIARIQP